jgi:hypothetical protein
MCEEDRKMTVVSPLSTEITPTGRQALVRRMQEIDARAGVVDDPTITVERLREMMRARGVRPEDNGASHELIQMRYGDDWDKE